MRKLKNEFSWSISRDKKLNECARSYYYHYYGSWGGWEDEASPTVRKAYILKNMLNLDMWAGRVIHDVIEYILTSTKESKDISFHEAKSKARGILNRGWRDSKSKRWQYQPKRALNLFEHYYDVDILEDRINEVGNRVNTCLRNFLKSEIFKFIKSVDFNNWLTLENRDYFIFEGIKVYVKPDFALKKGGNFYLYDWKSGKEDESIDKQLACYALFGIHKWNASYENLELIPVYLTQDTNLALEHQVPIKEIEDFKAYIKNSISKMTSMLTNKENNKGEIKNFPKTEQTWRCQRCFFRELCEGTLKSLFN